MNHVEKDKDSTLDYSTLRDMTSHLPLKLTANKKRDILHIVKKVYGIAMSDGKFKGLCAKECPVVIADIIKLLKQTYTTHFITITTVANKSDINIASDEGGVKHVSIDETSKTLAVHNSKGDTLPMLAGNYTGDLSFISAVIKVITASYCVTKYTGCELFFWRKSAGNAITSACSKCLKKLNNERYASKQKCKKQVLTELTDTLNTVSPHFKDHVLSQMQMTKEKSNTYNSR